MPQVIFTMDEFIADHGGRAAIVRIGEFVMLPDGATIDDRGTMRPPPTDPKQRRKAAHAYTKGLLARETNHFVNLKSAIVTQLSYFQNRVGPPPDQAAIDELQRLRAVILDLRSKLPEMEKQLQADTGMADAVDHGRQYAQQRGKELQEAVQQIEI